jgi:O-antigen/teichoic acid export membrane protein
LFIGESLIVPTGLLTVAFLTRRLGPEGYGLFTLAATMVLWIEFAITSFCSRPTIRFVGTVEDPSTVATTVSRLRLVIDLATMVLVWLAAPPVAAFLGEPEMTVILRLFAIDIPLYGRARVQRDILVGLGRYGRAALATSGRWIFRLVFIVILVEAGLSIRGAVIGSIGASIIEALINRTGMGWLLFGRLGFPVRRMLGYAVPLFLTSVLMLLFNRMDLFLLKILGATTARVGAYAASQNASLVVGILGVALSPVVLSTLSRQRASGERESARATVRNGLRAVVLYTPLVALISMSASEIVPFLFGPGFEDGIAVLAILSFAALGLVLHGVGCATLTAAGEPRLILALTVPVPVIALIGHLAVIPRYGMTGAATVSLVVTWLGTSLVLLAVARVWRSWPGLLTIVRSAATSVVVVAAAGMWSAPGAWVVVKLAVLAGFALLLLLVLGELKTPEIRSVMALFSADVGRDNGGGR